MSLFLCNEECSHARILTNYVDCGTYKILRFTLIFFVVDIFDRVGATPKI